MNTSELLQELRENVLRDVSDAESVGEQDLLWSNSSLLRYLNEAYFRFCRLSKYLQDATTEEVTVVELESGKADYPLNPAILEVLSAEYGNLSLATTTTQVILGDRPDTASPQAYVTAYRDHPVTAVVPDYQLGTLKVVGTPRDADDGGRINLRVCRLPLEPLKLDGEGPELPFHMQLDMLEWAVYRCLRNHDYDGENMQKANSHKRRFEEAVEEAIEEYRARSFAGAAFSPSWRW